MEVLVGSKRMSVLRSTSQRLATVKTSGCFRQAPDLSAALEPHPRSCTCSRCENRQNKAIKFRLPQSLSFPSIYILYIHIYIYKELLVLRICRNSILPPHRKKKVHRICFIFIEDFRRSNPEKFNSTKNPGLPPWITMVFSTAIANLVQFLQFLFTI